MLRRARELVTIAVTIISFGNRGRVVRQSAYFECLECANCSGGFGLADQISIKGSSCWSYPMSPTIAECLEHARQCDWYAAHTNNEEDRKFLLRRAEHWTKLAGEKELEIRAFARAAA
jgi:hypothetical protein